MVNYFASKMTSLHKFLGRTLPRAYGRRENFSLYGMELCLVGEEEGEDNLFPDAAKRPCTDSQPPPLTDLSEGPSCAHAQATDQAKAKKFRDRAGVGK